MSQMLCTLCYSKMFVLLHKTFMVHYIFLCSLKSSFYLWLMSCIMIVYLCSATPSCLFFKNSSVPTENCANNVLTIKIKKKMLYMWTSANSRGATYSAGGVCTHWSFHHKLYICVCMSMYMSVCDQNTAGFGQEEHKIFKDISSYFASV